MTDRIVEALERIRHFGEAIGTSGLEETVALAVEVAVEIVPGSSAALYACEDGGCSLDGEPWATAGTPPIRAIPSSLGMQAVSLRQRVLGKTGDGRCAVACFPMLFAGRPVGVLFLSRPGDAGFDRVEVSMLEALVTQAAMGIYHARRNAAMQDEISRKEDELARLRRAGLLISSRLRLDETLEAILQMALEVTGARYGIFRLVDREGRNLVTRAVVGERMGKPAVEALPLSATSVTGWAAKHRQPVRIADVRAEPWSRLYYPLYHDLEMRSELAVPLIGANGRLEGVLNLESPQVDAFSEEDSLLLQSLATQAVIAIQEARLLDALQEITRCLLLDPPGKVFDRLVAMACDLLNASSGAIWEMEGEWIVLRSATRGHVPGDRIPILGSLTGEAVRTRGPVISDDVRSDPRFYRPELARTMGWTRALIVPLLASEEADPVGALSVYGSESSPGHFAESDWDKKVLTILAHYAALAVHKARRQEELRLAQEQRAVAETFAAVGDVAANLLHNLNNKVGIIPVRVEGIKDKCEAILEEHPYLSENLTEIERSAVEAMSSVRESLSLLRPLHLAPVAVERCVREAVEAVRPPEGVSVRTFGLEDLPPVTATRQALTLVFTNLLENALSAMDGTGTIRIEGRRRGSRVEVSVQDTGRGIPKEMQGRVFDFSFSRGGSGHPSKLGFGLWWVKTLMTRLGGSVSVESDGVHGTLFRLTLPVAEGER